MRLEEIMSRDVKSVKQSVTADAAWQLMKLHDIHHLVVVENGEVVGIVSDRDLGGRNGAALRKGRAVEDVMTAQAISAKPSDTVRQAANLMRGRDLGCLPIVEGRSLRGIITVTDLLELIGRGAERPTARAERKVLNPHMNKAKKGKALTRR